MTTDTCALHIQTEQDARTVTEVIADEAGRERPLLAWADPDPLHVVLSNHNGRRQDFNPLVRGAPSWPQDLRLLEARLFWSDAALHVVSRDEGGCSWTRIEETDPQGNETDYARMTFRVFTIRDLSRFGLADESRIERLMAIEYRQFGRLKAWRLTDQGAIHVD